MIHHVVHVSGGKDSTALLLRALEHMDLRPHFRFQAVFADTDHEHQTTYDYVDFLDEHSQAHGGPKIQRVKADFTDKFAGHRKYIREKWPGQGIPDDVIERALELNQPSGNTFLDLCILRAGFPAPRARYCTDHLKIRPTHKAVFQPIWDRGGRIIAWRGIRADESLARSTIPRIQTLSGKGPLKGYHPLIDWTVRDVWLMHQRHGIKPNDLYRQGMTRVGCFPCIMTNKTELRTIAERFPEAIDKIEEWERIVGNASKRPQGATFFQVTRRPGAPKRYEDVEQDKHGIRDAVEWARTTRGGRQYDLIPIDDEMVEFGTDCSAWGVCE